MGYTIPPPIEKIAGSWVQSYFKEGIRSHKSSMEQQPVAAHLSELHIRWK